MRQTLTVDAFIQRLKTKKLTDRRTGQNVQYQVNDAAQAAFAIFFMQSAFFLEGQRHLQHKIGKSNAGTVFQMEYFPVDTHIRNLLDPVDPSELTGEFRFLLDELAAGGYLPCTLSWNQLTPWDAFRPSPSAIGMGDMVRSGRIAISTMCLSAAARTLCTLIGVMYSFNLNLNRDQSIFELRVFKITHSEPTPSGIIVANYERDGEVKIGSFGA